MKRLLFFLPVVLVFCAVLVNISCNKQYSLPASAAVYSPTPSRTSTPTFSATATGTPTTCSVNGTPCTPTWTATPTFTGTPTYTPTITLTPTDTPRSRWVRSTSSAFNSARAFHSSVVFNNQMWLIGGNYPTYMNDVYASSDGANWVLKTAAAAFSQRYGHCSVVFNNLMWVIGGGVNPGRSNSNEVWNSSDGINWNPVTTGTLFTARQRCGCVVYDDGTGPAIWMTGGYVDQGTNPYSLTDVWKTSDGVNWVQVTANAGFGARSSHGMVVHDDGGGAKMWVLGGSSSGVNKQVWSSVNGINWTLVNNAPPWAAREMHTAVSYNGRIWVIGGNNGFNVDYGDIWSSPDGVTWTLETPAAEFGGRYGHTSLVFDDGGGLKLWTIAGRTYSNFLRDVWHSP